MSNHSRIVMVVFCLILASLRPVLALDLNLENALSLDTVFFADNQGDELPAGGASKTKTIWQKYTLPDTWANGGRGQLTSGWYKASLTLNVPPNRLWGIWLPRLSLNAAIYLNGELLGNGGRMTTPVSRNVNRPLYFSIPNGLLRPGENIFLIRLVSEQQGRGRLGKIFLGPDEFMRPIHENRFFQKVSIPQGVALLLFVLSGLIAILGFGGRIDRLYGWFAAATLTWGVTTANLYIRDPLFSVVLWNAITETSRIWFIIFMALFFRRYQGGAWGKVEASLLSAGILVLVFELLTRYPLFFWWQNFRDPIALLFALYAVTLACKLALQNKSTENILMAVIAVVLVGLGIHDRLLQTNLISGDESYLYLGAPLFLLVIGWGLFSKFIMALQQAKTLNLELENRVSEKHRELENNFRLLQVAEKDKTLAEERTRIMADMHDGVGGYLISALAMLKDEETKTCEMEDLLQGALVDLRLMIDALDPVDNDLLVVLAMFRERIEPRLKHFSLEFNWQVKDLPNNPDLTPEKVLAIVRIFQEAVTNTMKYSHGKIITVSTGLIEPLKKSVFVRIEDDGNGFADDMAPGRGLGNMKKRALEIGGNLSIESTNTGTTVTLFLPLFGGGKNLEKS